MKRALPVIPSDRVVAPTPPPPDEGVVSWNMNTLCNYRCSYCTQRFLDDRKRWAHDVPAFLSTFSALPQDTGVPWEVKLSGGEPFLHPGFLDVVRGLRDAGLWISVVTNFSGDAAAFVDAAGDRLRVLSASLHLEFADVDVFRAKAAAVQASLREGASLVVTCVATQQNLPRLVELAASFHDVGVRFKVQPEKQDREIVSYDDAGKALLYRLGGHNGTGRIAHDFGGQPCWAGARYFIVDDVGEAFRCYPARRYRVERLGNVTDGTFRAREAAAPCLYRSCNCTVPIARGMMPVDASVDRFLAEELA
jgi:MoaA/NifB/PqqE/SkfB family radical SAM enzyme